MTFRGLRVFIRDEWFLAFSATTGLIFLLKGETLLDLLASPPWLAFILFWLFATVLGDDVRPQLDDHPVGVAKVLARGGHPRNLPSAAPNTNPRTG